MASGANSRRAKRVFSRTHSRVIRELRKFLVYVERADVRAGNLGVRNGYEAETFTGLGGTSVQAAIDTLKARCTAALAARA